LPIRFDNVPFDSEWPKPKTPWNKRKKPRREQLLDRIDKNPNDREAWNELARIADRNIHSLDQPWPWYWNSQPARLAA
jgi:hypothetical protein